MNAVLTKIYQKRANQIARKAGFGNATEIVLGDEDRVVSHVTCGYRKKSNGEYVSNSYYQRYKPAITVVMINQHI